MNPACDLVVVSHNDAAPERVLLDSGLCFVADDDEPHRNFVSLLLRGQGLETAAFGNTDDLCRALLRRTPDLIVLDVSSSTTGAIKTLWTLAERSYSGAVQLVGTGAIAISSVKVFGEHNGLTMLSPLRKPLDRGAIRGVARQLGLERAEPEPEPPGRKLQEALQNDWIEFWYQPKIDLRKKKLAGIEAFARMRHPQDGLVLPAAFMQDADAATLIRLAEKTLINALKTSGHYGRMGITFQIACNFFVPALRGLPVAEIVRDLRPKVENWPGLILDVTEAQVANQLEDVAEIARELRGHGVRLALDDFGRGALPLARLKDLPFAELKLDRSYIEECSTDKAKAAVCQSLIDVAHNFDASAVAIGIEKPADAMTLFRMGCDLGQGYLFAQPMPEDKFVTLLRQRAASQGRTI
jgi:EAL domain-containing protein (putative c-di-GMP-specific phosphodiesterase class I)/CheY-like chemotaxis protein